ncbi:AAA family ATPase [Clostridium sp. 19966]|uniref:ATP-binding protein n=1 Tax=Clostridium sp. 19966 TaxID=2768166 RepID=UPI0028DF4640|nr:AAA family ATPase [Clostridium sp. 19966]MDT8716286.1 AAA family ATPase [Clostridium sp. 19966]
MIIKEIKIKNFGKFTDFNLKLNEGMNIIYGENEAGKSTLQLFIKCMFYGMNSMKKNVRENERKRFLPWNGERAEGQLIFEYDGIDYVIERSFSNQKREDNCNIYNLLTGEKAIYFDNYCPGKDIFGLGEEAFEKTLFVKQLGARVARDKEDEIMKKLSNLNESADEDVSFHKSISMLDDEIKLLKGGRKQGKIEEHEEKISNLIIQKQSINKSHSENIELSSKLREVENQININKLRLDQLNSKRQITQKLFIYYQYNEIKNEKKKISEINYSLRNFERIFYRGSMEEAQYELNGIKEAILILSERKRDLNMIKKRYDDIISRKEEQEIEINKLKGFDTLDEDVEEKLTQLIHKQNNVNLYKEKNIEVDNIRLKQQMQLEKRKMNIYTAFIGVILMLSAVLAIALKNIIAGIPSIIGIILTSYSILNYINNSIELKKLNYSEALSNNYKETEIDEEVEKIQKYINFLLEHCEVRNIDEFYEKLRKYKRIKETLLSIRFEDNNCLLDLKRKEEQIDIVVQDLLIMFSNFNIQDNLKYDMDDIDSLYSMVSNIDDKLSEYNKLKLELDSCQNRYANLVKGTDFNQLERQMQNILSEIPDLLKYAAEVEGKNTFSSIEKLDENIKAINISLYELKNKKENLENKIMSTAEGIKIAQVEEEIERYREELKHYYKNFEAITLAKDNLQAAFTEIQKNYAPILNSRVSSIMSRITNRKYENIYISQGYDVTVKDKFQDKITEIDYLSGGTLDQIYFALRIGIADLIFKKFNVPIILDDAFIQFDEIRLKKTMEFLKEYSLTNQIVLFTCQENHKKYFYNAVISI